MMTIQIVFMGIVFIITSFIVGTLFFNSIADSLMVSYGSLTKAPLSGLAFAIAFCVCMGIVGGIVFAMLWPLAIIVIVGYIAAFCIRQFASS